MTAGQNVLTRPKQHPNVQIIQPTINQNSFDTQKGNGSCEWCATMGAEMFTTDALLTYSHVDVEIDSLVGSDLSHHGVQNLAWIT